MATSIERRKKFRESQKDKGLICRSYFLTIEEREVVDKFVNELVLKRNTSNT